MDTLTQIVLGACIGQAIGYRKLGAKAMVFGGVGGLIPDLDVLLTPFMGEYGSWKYHRHFTHALWFGPVLGSVMGWGLWRHYGRQMGHLWPWVAIMVLSILTHPLLDFCTIYGTQLLAPFSTARFEIASVSIIDPIYNLPLISVMILVVFKKFKIYAQQMAVGALIFTTAFLAFGWFLNFRAEDIAAKQLEERQISYTKIEGFTTIFQPFLRRILVTEEDGIRVGFVSTFNPQTIAWTCRPHIDFRIINAILETEDAQVFKWFSGDHLGFSIGKTEDEIIVTDLRYGIEGDNIFGWWGQIFTISRTPDGKLTARYKSRLRMERNTSSDSIINLFKAAYGADNTLLNTEDKGC